MVTAAPSPPVTRVDGFVRWFLPDRGFGFLAPAQDAGPDVFVTWADLPGDGFRTLQAGQRVTWIAGHDDHGPTASDVQLRE